MIPKILLTMGLLLCGQAAMAANRVVVSLQEQRLYVIDAAQDIVAEYPVGIGKPASPTPQGTFKVTTITHKPTWTVPASIMAGPTPPRAKTIPPGPENPLGAYFIRLNDSSYGIHGTTAPKLVPGEVSAGCIRMRNKDVAVVAELVERGTVVEIIPGAYRTEPTLPAAEVHESLDALSNTSPFLQQLQD